MSQVLDGQGSQAFLILESVIGFFQISTLTPHGAM